MAKTISKQLWLRPVLSILTSVTSCVTWPLNLWVEFLNITVQLLKTSCFKYIFVKIGILNAFYIRNSTALKVYQKNKVKKQSFFDRQFETPQPLGCQKQMLRNDAELKDLTWTISMVTHNISAISYDISYHLVLRDNGLLIR